MRVGLALSGADVAALAASTDGWAAGLRLATLFLRGGADASSLLGRHAAQMTSSVSSLPRASSTHWNRRSPTSCWQRRSPRGPAAHWHRRYPSSRAGWRCSKKSPVAGCSCIGSTTTPAGFVSPAVRRIPTPSTCTRRSRAESATAPHGGGMVRRTWLPQRGRQPCARGRRPETCR